MTTLEQLNKLLADAAANAERAVAGELEATYATMLRRAGRHAAASFETGAVTAAGEWQQPPEGILFSALAFAQLALERLGPLHRRVLRLVTGETLEALGIAWDITHPVSQEQLEQAGRRTGERLGEAVQPVIRQAVDDAYRDGLSVRDAAALILERVRDATPAQAAMLARTDLNGLSNGGSVAAARIAGAEFKQWLTAHDERVRPAHAGADGQAVGVDQPFLVGGEQLAYPGDPAGSDENTCNCRCTVIYTDGPEPAQPQAASGGDFGMKTAQTAAVTITVDETDNQDQTAEAPTPWVSDLAFEGMATEDGRYILPGALSARDLPLTLMAMTETGPGGHQGAYVAGRIDTIDKDDAFDMDGAKLPDGVTAIRGTGVFDVGGDNGAEIARLVGDETLRGVSIDMSINDWALRDPETGEILDPNDLTEEQLERAFFGELQFAIRDASIMAATVCPTPAFADARIAVAVTASGERVLRVVMPWKTVDLDAVTASAAGLAPVKPPREWFFKPEPSTPTPFTVTPDGQVFGHIALWGTCHTGRPGQCFEPPSSPSGYAYFNLGEIECDDGTRVPCGQVTMATDHAPLTPGTSWKQSKAHYENTGVSAADVRASDGVLGIWVAGALRPNLSAAQAREMMGGKPSGDWRQIKPGGPLELIGALEVNIPGYPVPRPQLALVASAADQDDEVVALVAAGIPDEDPPVRYHRR